MTQTDDEGSGLAAFRLERERVFTRWLAFLVCAQAAVIFVLAWVLVRGGP